MSLGDHAIRLHDECPMASGWYGQFWVQRSWWPVLADGVSIFVLVLILVFFCFIL